MNTKLNEGMRIGDLADLVIPLISCDEYQSDVDTDECIVFGFYVHDEDAANDLNRFLQKSSTPILDTKVSPAPDQHGYFMVFIELIDNSRLPEIMTSILAEIKSLVDIEDWQIRVRSIDGLIPYSEDNLKEALHKLKHDSVHEDIVEFLYPSLLSRVLFENELIILEGGGERHLFNIVSLDRLDALHENLSPMALDIRTVARLNRIKRSLGENWEVSKHGKIILLQNHADERGLLLQV